MPDNQKPICFAIAPIGAHGSETRIRSDKVLKHIFRKALGDKYDVKRADEIAEPGMIASQILRLIQECPLVVADLTEHNPNVFYEIAVRHAIEKPIIHLIEPRLSKIPFDISGFRTIEFDSTDLDSVEVAVKQLEKQAKQADNGNWGDTPIKLANIMPRSKGDSQEMLLLKEAVAGIADLRRRAENLERLQTATRSDTRASLSVAFDTALQSLLQGMTLSELSRQDLLRVARTELHKEMEKDARKPVTVVNPSSDGGE